MKKNILLTATLAFLGLATAPMFAQTSTSTTTTSGYIQSSTLIGSKIKDSRGQDVGEIKDVVLDRSTGCLAYVVLSTRGTGTTTTTKTVAAPWSVFSPSSEPRIFMTRIEREKIYSAPVWESTRIEEYSRPEYITQVYGYYGVTPSFSVGVTSTSGTTTTGATASTNASATPAATASVAATMTPAPTASAAGTMTPSTSASASTKPSPATTKSPATTNSPAAESATSPAPKKKSEKKKPDADAPKTDAAATDAPKSSTKKTETTKTKKAPKTETSTETTTDSTKSKSKKSEKKATEPETAPTP